MNMLEYRIDNSSIIFDIRKLMSQENMEECENCHKSIAASKIPTHLSYCLRYIKKCPDCSLLYDINEAAEHEDQYHRKQPCPVCGLQLSKNDLEEHKKICKQRKTLCFYCQLDVPDALFEDHLRMCESKTKQCEKCGKNVINKYYWEHMETCEGKVQTHHPTRPHLPTGKDHQNPINLDSDQQQNKNKVNSQAAMLLNRLNTKRKSRPVKEEKKPEFKNSKKEEGSEREKGKEEVEKKGREGEKKGQTGYIDVEVGEQKQGQKEGQGKRRSDRREVGASERRKRVKKGE